MHLTAILLAGFATLSIANPLRSAPQSLEPVLDASVAAPDLGISEQDVQNATLDKRVDRFLFEGQSFATFFNNFWVVSGIVTEIGHALLPQNMVSDAAQSVVNAYNAAAPFAYYQEVLNQNVKEGIVTLGDGFAISYRFVTHNSQAATRMFNHIAAHSATDCALRQMVSQYQGGIHFNLVDFFSQSVVATMQLQMLRNQV